MDPEAGRAPAAWRRAFAETLTARRLDVVAALCALALSGVALAVEPSSSLPSPFEMRLSISPGTVAVGSSPRLRLTLKNRTTAAVRFLPPDKHPAYYFVSLVEPSRAFSSLGRPVLDPAYPRDEWFVVLAPGESRTYLIPVLIADFSNAPRGTYHVSASMWPVWQCSCEWSSSIATFHVR